MSSLLVPIVEISEIRPHPTADRIELAIINEWQVVVGKGNYAAGDRVVYIPPNAVVPQRWSDAWEVTQHLSKGRVRCARLRGEPSFGFTVPVSDLPRGGELYETGENVAHIFDIIKWEPHEKGESRPGYVSPDALPSHPLLPKFTDVENLRHYPLIITEDEEVVMSEKIHGCLDYRTRVTMSDHTAKRIMNIEPGDEVLGVDEFGTVVPTMVVQKFNNGRAERWLTIKGKRRAVGRGNSFFAVHCTPNHQFWIPGRGYVEAGDLAVNMPITMLRSERGLTPIQEQVLLGKMLGDGHLHVAASGSAAVEFGHKEGHADYVDWTAGALGDLGTGARERRLSGYGTTMVRSRSVFSHHIAQEFGGFCTGDRKGVPSWVAEKIGPISMAFWYMDDGSLGHNEDQEDRANLATCGFSRDDCAVLVRGLAKFGIIAQIAGEDGRLRLRLNAADAERFFLLIAPYVPPGMQYKLPERYRGGPGWMPTADMKYKPMLVDLVIDSVEENQTIQSARWDIETGTHNFFANGVLVHNSNVRVAMIDGELMIGSHNQRKRIPEDYASSWFSYPLVSDAVRCLLETLGGNHKQVILYGETYGRVQKLHYGIENGLDFRAFDLMIDGKYVDYDVFLQHCHLFDVATVPELYRGPFTLSQVRAVSTGNTTLGGDHIREGCVVKPVVERRDPKIGRVILKYHNQDFLLSDKDEPATEEDAA